MKTILLAISLLSNLATLVGLWISYIVAPSSVQPQVARLLLFCGAIVSIVAYLVLAVFVLRMPQGKTASETKLAIPFQPRKVFVVSSGLTAWISGANLAVQFQILSTEPGELLFTKVQLTGISNGNSWHLEADDPDPMSIGVLRPDTKIIRKNFTEEELRNVVIEHGVSIRGYAKIRFESEQQATSVPINLSL